MQPYFVLGFVLLNMTNSPAILIRVHVLVEVTGERKGLGNCACRQLTATSSHFPSFRHPNFKLATEVVALISHVKWFHIFSRTGENERNRT